MSEKVRSPPAVQQTAEAMHEFEVQPQQPVRPKPIAARQVQAHHLVPLQQLPQLNQRLLPWISIVSNSDEFRQQSRPLRKGVPSVQFHGLR